MEKYPFFTLKIASTQTAEYLRLDKLY